MKENAQIFLLLLGLTFIDGVLVDYSDGNNRADAGLEVPQMTIIAAMLGILAAILLVGLIALILVIL